MATASLPKVVSVVLNWNGYHDTIECLESLLNSDYGAHHILVCDNGSRDGSLAHFDAWARATGISYATIGPPQADADDAALIEAQCVFVGNRENLGYAGGNNVGIRLALERLGARYVWILNNDTVVDRMAARHLTEFAERNPDVGIVGARVLQYYEPGRIQALGGGTINPAFARDTQTGRGRTWLGDDVLPVELEHAIGASLFARAEAIRECGYLDESYFLYREETDWCIRMRRGGWRILYCPDATVWHKEGASLGLKTVPHDYYSVRNMLFLIKTYHPDRLVTALISSFAFTVMPKLSRFQLRRLGAVFAAFVDFFRGIRGKTIDPEDYYVAKQSEDRPILRRESPRLPAQK